MFKVDMTVFHMTFECFHSVILGVKEKEPRDNPWVLYHNISTHPAAEDTTFFQLRPIRTIPPYDGYGDFVPRDVLALNRNNTLGVLYCHGESHKLYFVELFSEEDPLPPTPTTFGVSPLVDESAKYPIYSIQRNVPLGIHITITHGWKEDHFLPCNNEPCAKLGTQRCTCCLRVRYCSPECQRSDWLLHKKMCVRHTKR